MASCVIFGGAGFIGRHLAAHFVDSGRFRKIYLADIRATNASGNSRIAEVKLDVRRRIQTEFTEEPPEWIFNLAAVHREPGHAASEYFDTNLAGGENVCQYAEDVGCRYVYFTSSISVYGPSVSPTSEDSPIHPVSPYGTSKYPAEWIHRTWASRAADRRLIIARPGVIYGPGDPGNILRMIKAIRRGYFAFPGSTEVFKSYGYIYGLLESIDFTMSQSDRLIVYNYVESPTERLDQIVEQAKAFLGSRAPIVSVPLWALLPAATVLSAAVGDRTPIHPVRVRKAAMSTHIVPKWLTDRGFVFKYSFLDSLRHWRTKAPEDFA